jgi:hypothetical protein
MVLLPGRPGSTVRQKSIGNDPVEPRSVGRESLQAGADGIDHPFLFGELSRLEFRVDQLAVGGQLEASPASRDELQIADLLLVRREQLARQTDGLRLVVSHRTILQLEMHLDLLHVPARGSPYC